MNKHLFKNIAKTLRKDFGYWIPLAIPMTFVGGVLGITIRHHLKNNTECVILGNGMVKDEIKSPHWIEIEPSKDFKLYPKFKINW